MTDNSSLPPAEDDPADEAEWMDRYNRVMDAMDERHGTAEPAMVQRMRQRLRGMPAPGKDSWADRYAVDVPWLLSRLEAQSCSAVNQSNAR